MVIVLNSFNILAGYWEIQAHFPKPTLNCSVNLKNYTEK